MNCDQHALENIEPAQVFARFAEITRIPRGSGNERRIGDYLVAFAEKRGLEYLRDEAQNVLIRKPASAGCGNAPGVILQSHMDMVCTASPGLEHDFVSTPVQACIDGGFLRARGTTLGADDGIGMALALAMLDEKDAPHPALEALFTAGEETGMDGALAFDVSRLRGTSFINIDSEEEGIFYASCAGGRNVSVRIPLVLIPAAELRGGYDACRIQISGLRGGHSGSEIDKGYGSAVILLARVMADPAVRENCSIVSIAGGQASNAIPADAGAIVLMKRAAVDEVAARLAVLQAVFIEEMKDTDGRPDAAGASYAVSVTLDRLESSDPYACGPFYSRRTADAVVAALLLMPNGVEAMDRNMPGQELVETSSNLGIVRQNGNEAELIVSVRSSVASKKEYLTRRIALLAECVGAAVETNSDYPAWRFDPDSKLRRTFVTTYGKTTGKEAKVMGIHAGLECGIFSERFRQAGRAVDMISFGPDLSGVHTPDERLDIASTGRTWRFFKETMRVLAKQAK